MIVKKEYSLMLVLYFSGTGNTRYLAEAFARQMQAPCHSIEEPLNFRRLLEEHNPIAVCYPIYCSGIPRLMRQFAAAHRQQFLGKQVIIFCTQMLFSGDGARAFTDLFPDSWFTPICGEHFFLPGNLCNVLPRWTYGPLLQRWERRWMWKKLVRTCDGLLSGHPPLRGFHPLSRRLGQWQRNYLPAAESRASSGVMVNSDCTGCGACVRSCPVGNLKKEGDFILPQGSCMFCYRCVNLCPKRAITVAYRKPVVSQYKGPLP